MTIRLPRILRFVLPAAVFALAACSTGSRVVSQWNHPGYTAPSFRRIMIAASGGETAIRRNFEDEFVAQLKSAGVDALPSYGSVPDDPNMDEAQVKRAAKEAGADAVILARAVGVERRTEYYPNYYPYPAFGVFGPRFGDGWYGVYGPPTVRYYDVYTSETTLYDVRKNEIVWTATLRTIEPEDIAAATRSYVSAVIKALAEKNLIEARKK